MSGKLVEKARSELKHADSLPTLCEAKRRDQMPRSESQGSLARMALTRAHESRLVEMITCEIDNKDKAFVREDHALALNLAGSGLCPLADSRPFIENAYKTQSPVSEIDFLPHQTDSRSSTPEFSKSFSKFEYKRGSTTILPKIGSGTLTANRHSSDDLRALPKSIKRDAVIGMKGVGLY